MNKKILLAISALSVLVLFSALVLSTNNVSAQTREEGGGESKGGSCSYVTWRGCNGDEDPVCLAPEATVNCPSGSKYKVTIKYVGGSKSAE